MIEKLISTEHAEDIKSKIPVNRTRSDPAYYGANFSYTEDHGTAHLQVISENGDAVSVTSTINLL